jgi:hypothetical protein
MKRVCYEVKTFRSDFLAELKHPLKRRIGMRYSNEFYFVTPAQLVDIAEIPAECGLVEAGVATPDEWKGLIRRQGGFFSFDPDTQHPAPRRDTPGLTWHWSPPCGINGGNWRGCPSVPPAGQWLTFA